MFNYDTNITDFSGFTNISVASTNPGNSTLSDQFLLKISDMNFQLIFALCTMTFNSLAFIYFYFIKSHDTSIISKLTIMMFLTESISYYCNIVQLSDVPRVSDILKIRTIFSIFTFKNFEGEDNYYENYLRNNLTIFDEISNDPFSPSLFTLFKINTSIYCGAFTASLMLQLFITIELINIFKNPISDFSKRTNFYYTTTFLVSVFSVLLAFFYLIESRFKIFKMIGYTESILVFYSSQKFNVLIMLTYIAVSLFSIYYMVSVMRSKSSFRSREKIIFCIIHIIYMIVFFGFLVYPLYCFFSGEIVNVPVIIFMLNLSGLVLGSLRIFISANCFKFFLPNQVLKSSSLTQNELELENSKQQENDYNLFTNRSRSKTDGIQNLHSKTLEKLDSSDMDQEYSSKKLAERLTVRSSKPPVDMNLNSKADISLSNYLSNSLLFEYMYYIIMGIFKIGSDVSEKKNNPYFIHKNCYEEVMYHKFQQQKFETKENLEDFSNLSISSHSSLSIKNKLKNFCSMLNLFDNSITLKEYSPKVFRNILILDTINFDELSKSFDIQKNFDSLSSLSISEGKSGSFFFFTHDHRFIIKTISDTELKTMTKEFIQPYYELITENYNTLIGRTYGVYTLAVGMSQVNVILMENVAPIESKFVIRKFDLKGSMVGRETKHLELNNRSKTLKDKDFLEFKRLYPDLVNFEEKSIHSILETLKYDLSMLRKLSIMDYSFFITICDNENANFDFMKSLVQNRAYVSKDDKYIYFIGIIDYLTKFNSFKQIENKFKTLTNYKNRTEISAVHPVLYAERYANFILQDIFNIK